MSSIYRSMQFFMLFPNITSKLRKKMKIMVKYWKYSNQSRKVQKCAGISRLWSIISDFWVKCIWNSNLALKTTSINTYFMKKDFFIKVHLHFPSSFFSYNFACRSKHFFSRLNRQNMYPCLNLAKREEKKKRRLFDGRF